MEGKFGNTRRSNPSRDDHVDVDPSEDNRICVWVGNIPGKIHMNEFVKAIYSAGLPRATNILFKRRPVRSWSFLFYYSEQDAENVINTLNEFDAKLESRLAERHMNKEIGSIASETNNSGKSTRSGESTDPDSFLQNSVSSIEPQDHCADDKDADEYTLWHIYKDKHGCPYYYNKITGCTQWERPIPPQIAVENAIKDGTNTVSRRNAQLYVFYLPYSWDDRELAMHFTAFGNLVAARIVRDPQGRNTGFGYLSYDNRQCAAFAARLMNGYAVSSKFLKVELRRA